MSSGTSTSSRSLLIPLILKSRLIQRILMNQPSRKNQRCQATLKNRHRHPYWMVMNRCRLGQSLSCHRATTIRLGRATRTILNRHGILAIQLSQVIQTIRRIPVHQMAPVTIRKAQVDLVTIQVAPTILIRLTQRNLTRVILTRVIQPIQVTMTKVAQVTLAAAEMKMVVADQAAVVVVKEMVAGVEELDQVAAVVARTAAETINQRQVRSVELFGMIRRYSQVTAFARNMKKKSKVNGSGYSPTG